MIKDFHVVLISGFLWSFLTNFNMVYNHVFESIFGDSVFERVSSVCKRLGGFHAISAHQLLASSGVFGLTGIV